MSVGRILVASVLVCGVLGAGCASEDRAAGAPSSSGAPAPTRPVTELLLTAADTPEAAYRTPPPEQAARLGAVAVAVSVTDTDRAPACRARDAAIALIDGDPSAGALVTAAPVEGASGFEVHLAVLNRVIDTSALAVRLSACPSRWTGEAVTVADGSQSERLWEVPTSRQIAGVGAVAEMSAMRRPEGESDAAVPTVIRFVEVGGRTVVQYISAPAWAAEIPAEGIAFGDRLLDAQVAKVRGR
ncbi:hypothetical protein ACWEKT_13220 [Nocardia takedensis]